MLPVVLYVITLAAFVFWLVQLIDLLLRADTDFESRTHKLTWFVALFTGTLVAAIWHFLRKPRGVAGRTPHAGA